MRVIKFKQAAQRGFTLIELMIVIAIIGILAAVALPQYQNYTIRAKLSEAILAASSCRTSISESVQSAASIVLPGANSWGCEVTVAGGTGATKYVDTITTNANGVITVTTSAAADLKNAASKTFQLVPYAGTQAAPVALANATDGGSQIVLWKCGPGGANPIETKYLPGSCKSTAL